MPQFRVHTAVQGRREVRVFEASGFEGALREVANYLELPYPFRYEEFTSRGGIRVLELMEPDHPIYPGIVCACGAPTKMVMRDFTDRFYRCMRCQCFIQVDPAGWRRTESCFIPWQQCPAVA